ncbi:S-adenosyl-L-methionine-dependent methyltransferase [Auricularia subglabra TFB-10046 SS5]|nr:S-adenosyl-L-methionine-dependent methyltransferase [Auricularia subglabra TFB-10046 SS5]
MLKVAGKLPQDEDPYSSGNTSSGDSDDDQDWADWQSDGGEGERCASLFEANLDFASAADCVAHDAKQHGFDLITVSARLGLDFHQRVRLVNYIRKQGPPPDQLNALTGNETFFSDDAFLVPVIQNDPLFQLPSDDWSDEEDTNVAAGSNQDIRQAQRQVKRLQEKLQRAKQDLVDYKKLVQAKLDITNIFADDDPGSSESQKQRDDDTHYFESYAENDIHAVMINDKVRTSTYASFIARNPLLFHDAVVLDVGCGTGILSLLAARAGARKVIAVDASDIVHKARQIVKDNELEDIITVVHGKIENITLPDGIEHVDIIVSEWMGYALIYESMLDSVLVARERFLQPEKGLLAPSHARMMLALCDASDVYKERVAFWDDVYGFNMSCMAQAVPDDAVIDVVPGSSLLSEPASVRELPLHAYKITDAFATPFRLVATQPCAKVRAFVLYFDVFFATSRESTPAGAHVKVVAADEAQEAEVWPIGRTVSGDAKSPALHRRKSSVGPKGSPTSFSTGPQSVPTHWKQTLFLLREPLSVTPGAIVQGTFFCRKSTTNSRELDVEIHYSTLEEDAEGPPSETTVQIFKIR